MHISQIKDLKYLRKEDCGKGILVTIDKVELQTVGQGQEAEEKYTLTFREDVLPMVLNITNARLIASITGSEETEDWQGHQIVCYNDPTIAYAGRVTGGIRVRAPKAAARTSAPAHRPAPAPAPAPARPTPVEEEGDDVPF